MTRFKFKTKKVLSAMTIAPCLLLLGGCSSATQTTLQSSDSSSSDASSQQEEKPVDLYYGIRQQAQGILTIPVYLVNNQDNDMDLSSQNFILKAYGHSFRPFQISGEASDFHDTLSSGSTYRNILSFYLGTDLTAKQLQQRVTLYYDNNGKIVKAEKMTVDAKQNINSNTPDGSTDLASYYENTISYIKELKKDAKDGSSSSSIEDQFNDADYDKLYFWTIGSKYNKNKIYAKIVNKTNTDFYLNMSEIELINPNGNEIHVDSDYQDNYVVIPHGKTINTVIPLEANISKADSPYTVQFRTDMDSSFFNTNSAFHPVEMVFSDSKTLQKAFTLSPDQYPSDALEWKNPKFKKNSFSVDVSLKDYFVISANAEKFKLVGLNKDGTVGDSETPLSITPESITANATIKMKFDDLTALKTYAHIVLKYGNTKMMTIRNNK